MEETSLDTASVVKTMAIEARKASRILRRLTAEEKNAVLEAIRASLVSKREAIFAANAIDIEEAVRAGLSPAFIDRLTLNEARFDEMCRGLETIVALPDPVGETILSREMPSGISIRKIREPFGVVAVVFESRPNVFVDTAALCLKTGNAIILRGGKEALRTNMALAEAVKAALPWPSAVQLVETADHAAVREIVRAVGLVDIAIPRGGEKLIRAMCEAALIPVLKHYKGVCHIYVDDKADLGMALSILDNAKVQRPSACNAVETLVIHEKLAPLFLPMVKAWAKDVGVKLHEDGAGVEYLSLDLNIAIVKDYREAIDFINANSSGHSEAIITSDEARAAEFLRDVDSACVYHNASTRFTDGAQFGMGAEIGISTDKLHARGPMGLEELTTYKYVITGDGTIRA